MCVVDAAADDAVQHATTTQSSAESTADDDVTSRSRSQHRRILRLDGRSSSETSGASTTGDHGHSPALRRGSSVDEAIRSSGHNRHVSFILSSGRLSEPSPYENAKESWCRFFRSGTDLISLLVLF